MNKFETAFKDFLFESVNDVIVRIPLIFSKTIGWVTLKKKN